jgi:hypothetical protein
VVGTAGLVIDEFRAGDGHSSSMGCNEPMSSCDLAAVNLYAWALSG